MTDVRYRSQQIDISAFIKTDWDTCEGCAIQTRHCITPEDDWVCTECGLVGEKLLTGIPFESNSDNDDGTSGGYRHHHRVKSIPYNRVTFITQHLHQLTCDNPPIHSLLFGLVQDEAENKERYGPIGNFTKSHVRSILRNVIVPQDLQEKFKSKPRAQNRYKETPHYDMKRYLKNWRWIIDQLGGPRADMDGSLQTTIKAIFVTLLPGFYNTVGMERKHFPNYYYSIMKILQILDSKMDEKYLVKSWRKWFPMPPPPRCLKLDSAWKRMCDYANYPFIPTRLVKVHVMAGKKKLKQSRVSGYLFMLEE